MTKKLLAALLAATMLCLFMPTMVSAAPVDITADFTDPNFKAAVYAKIGKTAPAPIYDTDAAVVSELNVSSKGIQRLDGLEHFKALRMLNCSGNQLASLPALPSSLVSMNCSYNQLTSLPAPLPSNATHIWCNENQLTSLPALPSGLVFLACDNNQLTSLPAPLPSGLEYLVCYKNRLTSLPKLPATVSSLECFHNQLTTIDVTGLSLQTFTCYGNNMKDKSAVIGFTGDWNAGYWTGVNYGFEPQNGAASAPTEPSCFAKIWAFIVKWIFFGWLWQK